MASTKHTVLIVDDDEDILELLLYNLKSDGYHVEIAKNGIQAIEVAKTTLPELIIMDIMMPKMDGVEACRHIRQVPELANTHVIFLTARVEEYSEIEMVNPGIFIPTLIWDGDKDEGVMIYALEEVERAFK